MISISPLQLLDFQANLHAYERHDADPVPEDVEVGIGLGIAFEAEFDDERDALCVRLVVQFNPGDDMPEDVRPYVMHRGELRVTGWLTWISEDVAMRDDARRLLLVNGLSMLFGIARVRIADLTSGSDRRLVLPSINFRPIVEDFLDEGDPSTDDPSDDDGA